MAKKTEKRAKALLSDEAGATAIEYALIVAVLSIGALSIVGTIGGSMELLFNTIGEAQSG